MMNKFCILLSGFLLTMHFAAQGQNFNDPYSAYGLGEVQPNEFVHLRSVQSLGLTHRSQTSYSLQNPATLSFLEVTVFNVGLNGSKTWFEQNGNKRSEIRADFSYMALAFPVLSDIGWSAGFGLKPLTKVGYEFSIEITDDNVDLPYTMINTGQGGLTKAYISNGFQIFKGMNIGFEVSYLFGSYEFIDRQAFASTGSGYLNKTKNEKLNVSDFNFKGGIQFHDRLSKDYILVAGASASLERKLSADKTILTRSFGKRRRIKDTISNETDISGNITLPANYSGAVELQKSNEWRLGAGFSFTKWDQFKSYGDQDSVGNSWEANLAYEIVPDQDALDSYFERVSYRIGINYANSYLAPKGQNLDKYSINFGFGFPLSREQSDINLAFELGTLGNGNEEIPQKEFFNFSIGFNINEKWFRDRKIK